MIPVNLAAEPEEFDRQVRVPGTTFLAGLQSLVDVDFNGREYWRRAIPQLRDAYRCVCAYTCHWVALDTGGNSADHFIPRKFNASLAYEWNNLRFVCSRLNARKGVKTVLDPLSVVDGMFVIIFPSLHISPSPEFADNALLSETIEILKLNDDVVVSSREEYVSLYASNKVDLEYLAERAPFIFAEITRLGLTRRHLQEMNF